MNPTGSKTFSASPQDSPKRIDKLVAEKTGITRSQVQRLIGTGIVLVNGNPVKPNYRVRENDKITVTILEKEPLSPLLPEDIPVDILYKDEHLTVVNKPPGMVVYPAAGHARGTLMNALCFHLKKLTAIGGPLRPGVVHRLDKDTSGLMVIALTDNAYYSLARQFRQRTINRRYLALIYGSPKHDRGEISLRVGRSGTDRKKMSTKTKRGKEARTLWEVADRFKGATLIKARLATGRTHQIRVHFSSIGHPVLGDRTYGKKTSIEGGYGPPRKGPGAVKKISFPRQMLHAELLGFIHPVTGNHMEFKISLPEDMEEAIRELRANKLSQKVVFETGG